jgi:thioester reductase-like protein
VGSHILAELLESTELEITCLVRAADLADAKHRLGSALAKLRRGVETGADRARILCGALGTPRFGLSELEYRKLTGSVDAVVHCAAQVNFVLPYPSVRGNVLGTRDIINFCCEGRKKFLHFVSTYSVLDPERPELREELLPVEHSHLDFGYARSKWVCEHLLASAMGRGLACRIYRPSRIVSGSPVGVLNHHDFYSLVLAGSLAAGAVPDEAGSDNFVDVAGVARRIAVASSKAIEGHAVVHLCGNRWTGWDEILAGLGGVGINLEKVAYADWIERVSAAASNRPALLPFLEMRPFLRGSADRLRQRFARHQPRIAVTAFDDGARLDVQFSPELLRSHLAQLVKGFALEGVGQRVTMSAGRQSAAAR